MKLVLVEWEDSASFHRWMTLDELVTSKPMYCRSVGWLLVDNKDCKVLVPHIAGEKNGDLRRQGTGELSIPTRAITKIRVLQK